MPIVLAIGWLLCQQLSVNVTAGFLCMVADGINHYDLAVDTR